MERDILFCKQMKPEWKSKTDGGKQHSVACSNQLALAWGEAGLPIMPNLAGC
jgi:hypothetical protein